MKFVFVLGQSSDRSSVSCFSGTYFKYALYAWIVPLLIVTLAISLDVSDVVAVGYGKKDKISTRCLFIKYKHPKHACGLTRCPEHLI